MAIVKRQNENDLTLFANTCSDEKIQCQIDKIPDYCPLCHTGIKPSICYAQHNRDNLQIVFKCPRERCQQLFIGSYVYWSGDHEYFLRKVAPINHEDREFSEEIKRISKTFTEIYNQASHAEEIGLTLIAGPGYGKALEFLIKDYVISLEADPSRHEGFKNKSLGNVIKDYINDDNIKSVAERAAWLRNDETHYLRLWDEMDLENLKILLELTKNHIENEERTRSYKEQMPQARKR